MATPELTEPSPPVAPGVALVADRPRRNWWLQIDARRRRFLLVLLVVAASGAISALWAMPHRMDSGGDAAAYAGIARNITAGRGITSPFVNEFDGLSPSDAADLLGHSPVLLWPPLYPITLAAGAHVGLDPGATARLVNLLSVVAAGMLAAGLAARLSRGSTVAALTAGLLLVFSQPVGASVIAGYSDAFFLALALGAVHLLLTAVSRTDVVTVGLFMSVAGAAALTRYVGLGLVAGGAVALVACGQGRTRWLWGPATALAALPSVLWLRVARAEVGNPVGVARFQPRTELVSAATSTATDWLAPAWLPAWWRTISIDAGLAVLALAAALLVLGALLRRRRHPVGSDGPRRRPRSLRDAWMACGLAGGGLLVVLVLSAATVGAGIVLNGRMLLAVQGVVVPMACAAVALSIRTLQERSRTPSRARALRVAIGAGTAVVVLGVIVSGVHNADQPVPTLWSDVGPAEADALAPLLAGRTVVFSDAPSQLYALSQTSSAMVPTRTLPSTGTDNPDFGAQLDDLVRIMRERNGAAVLFASAHVFSDDPANEVELIDAGGFEVVPVSPLVHVVVPKH